jgi:ribokinase
MSTSSIVVLGSANMDLVVTVDRSPRLGETVAGHTFHTVPGGKGANQALAAARAGADVRFLGAVGDDVYGEQIRALFTADGVAADGLATSSEPTGTAHIVVDGEGGNSIVVVPGANGTVTALTDVHRAAIESAGVLLLQLELPATLVVEAVAFARSAGVRTVLTPAPADNVPGGLLDAIDLVVPNEHELALLTGTADPSAAAQQLARRSGEVLVTLGERGAMLVCEDAEPVVMPAFDVDVVDTTAAGDTFVGAYAAAMVSGLDSLAAMRRASAAAALSVGRLGASTSMPDRDEIDAFLAAHPSPS